MAYQNISAILTEEQKNRILEAVLIVKENLPFLINLTPADRKRLRKRGPRRVGYVKDVSNAVNSHPNTMPSTFDISEFAKDTTLLAVLEEIAVTLMPVYEAIDDTLMAVGSEAMSQADTAYGYLKVGASKSKNQALTEVVKKIAANLKMGPRKPKPQP